MARDTLRVALVSPPFESVPPRLYGGTERVVNHLASGLSALGHEVTVFASGDSCPDGGVLVPYTEVALRLRNPCVSDFVPYHLKLLAEVAERAQGGRFDVIHNHDDYWLMPLSKMVSTPVLTTLHGRLDLPDIAQAYLSYPQNYFISISDSQRSQLPGLQWLKTIHHGIDLSRLKFHARPGQYLAFLGRITSEKRPEWAIEIAQRAGIPLKIAAKVEGRESQEYYDTFIKPHVDGRNIEFIGEISDTEKSDFLGNALGLVFPIDWPEPFGLVVAESLACGTPVLARPCGSMNELLENGVTGFSSWDIGILAQQAAELPSLDRRLCRQWVEDHFSLERMTEDYIDAYKQLTRLRRINPQRDPQLSEATG